MSKLHFAFVFWDGDRDLGIRNSRQVTRDTGAEAGELLLCKITEADQINQRSQKEKRALTWEGNR